ncbi:TPA: hypothetical protein ENG04_08320 [Candidatus Poribacteria bacterium]|nr:hypothetical protein [Candidatus Poribacteria bacterium]HEX30069.1 hypothetical protein [Candidatus Poribacteria bacterium]
MRKTAILTFLLLAAISVSSGKEIEISIDGQFDDWEGVREYTDPEGDTFGGPDDPTLDILSCRIANDDELLYVYVTVKDDIANGKTSRGAYQTVIDADNNYDTGIQSDKEAPYPPHERPLGVDFYISVETKQGVYQGVGIQGYASDAANIDQDHDVPGAVVDAVVVANKYELKCDLKSLGVKNGDMIRLTILHYSAADTVDWIMPPIDYRLGDYLQPVDPMGKLTTLWGMIK